MTIHAKLLTKRSDSMGYTEYVFMNLEFTNVYDKYIMCVRFPNWDHPKIEIEEFGFLEYRSVIAGKDKWYDHYHNEYIPYKYTDNHFIKFIPETQNKETDYTM